MFLSILAGIVVFGLGTLALWLCDGLRLAWHCRIARNRASSTTPLQVVIESREDYTADLFGLVLRPLGGGQLPAFQAGQYLTVNLPRAGLPPSRRCYSLAAWQTQPRHYQLGIRRVAGGGVSEHLYQFAQPGTRLEILPPRGGFTLQTSGGVKVLIGGGIGVTPLRAMLHTLLNDRDNPGSTVYLFHAVRHAEELCYHAEFIGFQNRHSRFRYRPIVSRPNASWPGETGRLNGKRIVDALDAVANAEFYLCANIEMTAMLRADLTDLGIPPDRIFSEGFGGLVPSTDDAIYRINIVGKTAFDFQGRPTLMHGLESAGIAINSDCRAGHCGACRVRADSGDYRWLLPPTMTLGEREILACCTLPLSDMTLSRV
ncbi:iron-sulfur cluster-binding domain-containing protein [Methylomonas sp. ZR1]|uniref:iron-sulfur cluster-binding domain-containing protein n=1 Tax=Methylomonas sp. ZR1 TaxID=1797072 RepID=UPI001490CA4C|nr:iron-sulfur cluster-binding domain-containing protein [Methylomonas sp. ZR1]NOV30239.1 iron-sulfur cluster-binding domain-containing protein [Methylomonas sp. ZR1]